MKSEFIEFQIDKKMTTTNKTVHVSPLWKFQGKIEVNF